MKTRRDWSTHEVRYLIQGWGKADSRMFAATLDRSRASVQAKACRLGLSKVVSRSTHAIRASKSSKTVKADFFDRPMDQTLAHVLGFVYACGRMKTQSRMIIRLRVETSRCENLKRVLTLIGSKHCIQSIGEHLVVEVCNKYLVESFLRRWGPLQSKREPSPGMPNVDGFLTGFARGHLLATGLRTNHIVCWAGTKTIVRCIAAGLQNQLELPVPKSVEHGNQAHASWTDPNAVKEIQEFLGIAKYP